MLYSEFSQLYAERVNRCLDNWLPPASQTPERLHQAMRYAVCQGGKRIRPLLVYATGIALDAPLEDLDRAAAAIELIHAYSLTHDDLPAMDNDDFRRGQPTCHKAYDDATAILVGDALQSLAFLILSEGNNPHQLQMIRCLAHACGSCGMAGGQSLDLSAMNRQVSMQEIEEIHRLKTGALIMASVQLGCYCSPHQDQANFTQLSNFANHLGLAYQVQDDLFDESASLIDVETCKRMLTQLGEKMQNCLQQLPIAMPDLTALYQSITQRTF